MIDPEAALDLDINRVLRVFRRALRTEEHREFARSLAARKQP